MILLCLVGRRTWGHDSIPLIRSVASLVVRLFSRRSLNTMTLGGLALAIGPLVDDSTVATRTPTALLTEEGQPGRRNSATAPPVYLPCRTRVELAHQWCSLGASFSKGRRNTFTPRVWRSCSMLRSYGPLSEIDADQDRVLLKNKKKAERKTLRGVVRALPRRLGVALSLRDAMPSSSRLC